MAWLLQQILPTTPFEWVSMLVRALVWPATSVIVVALLRAEVRQVLERMIHLKYRDFEAQFHQELGQVERLEDGPPPKRLLDLPTESRRVIHELESAGSVAAAAHHDARAVIHAAWTELSSAVDRTVASDGDPTRALAARGVLSGAGLLAFERLRQLHRRLADLPGWNPPPAIANRYAALTRPLAARIGQFPGGEGR